MSKVIYSLFDGSGYMVKPWADAGYKCYCFNSTEGDHGGYEQVRIEHPNITYVECWIDTGFPLFVAMAGLPLPGVVFSFPPCTDLTNAGSRHWAAKAEVNSRFQDEAAAVCRIAAEFADSLRVPYMIENPVGKLSSLWRKPDAIIQPFQFGGYLPEDDEHPAFPDIIPARDGYQKTTCLWTGNGFVMPEVKAVPNNSRDNPGWKKLGGKSKRTKLIRSLTPRGFASAVMIANSTK